MKECFGSICGPARAWPTGIPHFHLTDKQFEVATRPQVPRGVVVEEWEALRPQGFSKEEVARRLGMTLGAFNKALKRARSEAS